MSREIKFRAWHRKSKQFFVKPDGFTVGMTLEDIAYLRGRHPLTEDVQQYTGLKDKNGVEIYEGDIVQWNVFPGTDIKRSKPVAVEFKSGLFCTDSMLPILGNIEPHRELEVIGNIYENPELIKEGN